MFYSKQFLQASAAEYNQLLNSEMKINCVLRNYGLVLFWKNWPAWNLTGLQGFKLKISKTNQQRQTIFVIFCISESVAFSIPNIAYVFTKRNPLRGTWNRLRDKRRAKKNGIESSLCKKFKLLIDRFSPFFAKRRKSVEKMIHKTKNRGHLTSKIIKSKQSYTNGHPTYPIIVHFIT